MFSIPGPFSAGITFSEPVDINGSVIVRKRGGAAVPGLITSVTNPSGDGRTFVLAFSGTAFVNGSLVDGMYEIAVSTSLTDVAGTPLTQQATYRFHRLFGDADGDRDVDAADLAKFRQALNRPGSYVSWFDSDNSGTITNADYIQLRSRLNKPLLK